MERSWKKSRSKRSQTEGPKFDFQIERKNSSLVEAKTQTQDSNNGVEILSLEPVITDSRKDEEEKPAKPMNSGLNTANVAVLGIGMFAMGLLLGKAFRGD